ITLGEGWHNNHHAYQSSTRQGFRWWEIDPTYYVLKVLSWFGIVWDLRSPPPEVVRNERRLGRRTVEKVARQLALSFPIDRISEQVAEAWAKHAHMDEVRARLKQARENASALLRELELPHIPTAAELRARAQEMFAYTPSLDEIVARAEQLILDAVSARVFGKLEGTPA